MQIKFEKKLKIWRKQWEGKAMKQRCSSSNKAHYETTELKLSALLLAQIPESTFEIHNNGNPFKKIIKVIYPREHERESEELIRAFIERRAIVDVFRYNKVLNVLRDELKRS